MELIYSVKDIFVKYLNGNEKFAIPAYQRGYKWKTKDIEQLLNDINAFQTHGDDDVFYCLQNITLVREGDNYNVVDGQQRLTTLTLMLSYLDEYKLVEGKLDYQIRKESQKFLSEYVYSHKLNTFKNNKSNADINSVLLEWDKLGIRKYDEYNYQDIFYMYNAYRTVQQWFTDHEAVREEMKDKLLNRVKLIVNLPQISSNQELELFDNLNGKRVSLDGADLIRAMIVTRVARKDVEDIEDSTKHDVMLNENRVKNGLKLDEINRWWCDSNRQEYYKVFVRNINSKGENIMFDENKYPIDILYKLFIQTSVAKNSMSVAKNSKSDDKDSKSDDKDSKSDDKDNCLKGTGTIKLQYFENANNITEIFAQLQNVQRLVEYWYDDDELYHLVLYSAIYLKMTFYDLTNLWSGNNRNSFVDELKEKILSNEYIKLALKETDDNGKTLSEEDINFYKNWYDGDDTDLMPVMILSDIVRILNSKSSKFPIANLDPSHFVPVKEDKEHIFPQTPLEKGFTLDTLKNYIEVAFDCGYSHKHKIKKDQILAMADYYYNRIKNNDDFRTWFNNKMTSIIPLNSLGNLCLLQDKVNRSYGNDFFAQKHFDIMHKSANGEYIRPHVLDAFTKVMASENQRHDFTYMQRWTKEDIIARRKHIVEQLKNYLEKV